MKIVRSAVAVGSSALVLGTGVVVTLAAFWLKPAIQTRSECSRIVRECATNLAEDAVFRATESDGVLNHRVLSRTELAKNSSGCAYLSPNAIGTVLPDAKSAKVKGMDASTVLFRLHFLAGVGDGCRSDDVDVRLSDVRSFD